MRCEISKDREQKTAWFTRALASDGFDVFFQPVVHTSARDIVGHECLIRSQSRRPSDPVHAGDEIFETARARNLVEGFDARSMALAVRCASAQSPGTQSGCSRFFVNVLAGSISDPELSFGPALASIADSGMRPENFVFEAVDSELIGDSARLRSVRDYLRDLGAGFALDNMGMGPGGMELIAELRPDYIKIDKRLVWNAEQPLCASTIRRLVEAADRNGIEAIAVGVERPRMAENLWLLGVKVMQGYLFGRAARRVVCPGVPAGSSAVSDLAHLAVALAPSADPAPLFADLYQELGLRPDRHEEVS